MNECPVVPVRLEEVEDGVEHAAEVGVPQHRDARQHLYIYEFMCVIGCFNITDKGAVGGESSHTPLREGLGKKNKRHGTAPTHPTNVPEGQGGPRRPKGPLAREATRGGAPARWTGPAPWAPSRRASPASAGTPGGSAPVDDGGGGGGWMDVWAAGYGPSLHPFTSTSIHHPSARTWCECSSVVSARRRGG